MHICVDAPSIANMSAAAELNTVKAFKKPAVNSAKGFFVF